ncbi:MAG TPA: valine--tRNA ligase, partial [Candidatus Polarisedimenticolaceae bacterium]|nr:valine--tRNA ligase [Candidatus Polarisedimenticolaceae bacterium]
KLYRIRYPAAGGGAGVEVATTRPETLLGDTAVAVHPADERYRKIVGGKVEVPLTGRSVPVIADEFVDREFGTGAVKITPAHDPNDFDAGLRHRLPQLAVIDTTAKMTPAAGRFAGLDRFEARRQVVDALEQQGLLVDTRPHEHAVGHCQRCGTMIEPLVSTQWFVKIAPLAQPAIEAVERGATRFVPDNWSKTYFEWMRNIHDWCISRQLWWGHRIPAWYCDRCDETIVALESPAECPECRGALRQDEDVLDTWFSSALWPFSTLGWPEQSAELKRYYPTSVLITGHDIIFFWVARMMMMGLHFIDLVPFREVYIHGLVRDAHGQKMSKSKGNTVDPVELQARYGTDAVRFTMAILAAPGNDIPLAHERMEGYRAFANKLWNASRFVLLKLGDRRPAMPDRERLGLVDRWILSRLRATIQDVDRALGEYRFDRAADRLYHMIWHEFCDWYIELAKPAFDGTDAEREETASAVLLEVLATLLRLLHPMMPYVSEELWQRIHRDGSFLAVARWPEADDRDDDAQAERDVELLQEVVTRVRNMRAESNIAPGQRVRLMLHADDAGTADMLRAQAVLIGTLVRAERVEIVDGLDRQTVAARGLARGVQIAIPLAGVLDLAAERGRLLRELAKLEREIDARRRKLDNPSFREKAPADVVDKERRIQQEVVERFDRLQGLLAGLGSDSAGGG